MRILSLTAPWGSLIALGYKRIETRNWSTPYRGPIAIHQAKGLGNLRNYRGLFKQCNSEPFKAALTAGEILSETGLIRLEQLHLGHIIAVAELVDIVQTWPYWAEQEPWFTGERKETGASWQVPPPEPERSFGDYSPDRFAWLLDEVRPLREPLQWKGAQGLRVLPEETAAEVLMRAA